MSHPFDKLSGCTCDRCTRERARRAAQAASKPMWAAVDKQRAAGIRFVAPKRTATRKQQHATYLDCGPGAWDDRGPSLD